MRVIIIHGCAENEKDKTCSRHWISWLKNELEERGIKTYIPLMPRPWEPGYISWKKELDKLGVDEDSVLIGHSCGCAFLVRWLGETKKKIKKLILVAPWKIPSKEFSEGENEMYDFDIDKSIKDRVNEIIFFTSDDEEDDGKKSLKIYHGSFGGEFIELKGKGHFLEQHMGTNEFPELLEEVLK